MAEQTIGQTAYQQGGGKFEEPEEVASRAQAGQNGWAAGARTNGVDATLKYKFWPNMDAVMATHVMATVKMVSAWRPSTLLKVVTSTARRQRHCENHTAR